MDEHRGDAPDVAPDVVLAIRAVSKAFSGIYALRDVSLDIRAGEIHAIMGGNGSGKSTLIKALAGVQPADDGTLEVDGETYDLRQFTPQMARRSGVHVVHQHRTTFGSMTVAENLSIGRGFETSGWGQIRWRRTKDRAGVLLREYGIRATPDSLVSELGPADETMLEIARALQDQEGTSDGVLLLDEPTAALPAHEVQLLLDALRRYAAQGQAVVFISHRLDEVVAISDRVTVLRDGEVAARLSGSQVTRESIVEAMVGRIVASTRTAAAPASSAPVVLRASGLAGGNLRHADLVVRAGEIVGVAGLAGSGRSTLLRLLFGAQPSTAGTVTVDGSDLDTSDPARTIRAGVAFVPEDRASDAAFADMSVVENFTIAHLRRFTRMWRVSRSHERSATHQAVARFLVKAASPVMPLRALSGGNQQKVMIARWLVERPKVLLLDEPTQGVDVGARAELWDIVQQTAADGLAVVLVSSDLEELTHLSTRIIVLRDGVVAAELTGPGLTNDDVNAALHTLDVAA